MPCASLIRLCDIEQQPRAQARDFYVISSSDPVFFAQRRHTMASTLTWLVHSIADLLCPPAKRPVYQAAEGCVRALDSARDTRLTGVCNAVCDAGARRASFMLLLLLPLLSSCTQVLQQRGAGCNTQGALLPCAVQVSTSELCWW